MAPPAALAFIRSRAGLDRLPPDCRVVPLRPGLPIPKERQLVDRPEDLLGREDLQGIRTAAGAILSGWRSLAPPRRLAWRGVDLGECFEYELRLIALDLAKTALIVERAVERAAAGVVLTDAPVLQEAFPPYPYLTGTGNVAEGLAAQRGWQFRNLGTASRRRAPRGPRSAVRVYGALAARQGAAQIRKGRPLVAIGPHPEFYRPLARAWKAAGGTTVVLTPSGSPIRAAAKDGLYLATVEALVNREDREAIRAFVASATREAAVGHAPIGPLNEAIAGPLRAHVSARLREWLVDLAGLGAGFERGLERAEGLVLLETASPFASAGTRYARKAGVPCTVLQHGVIAEAFSYRQLDGDRVAAWGRLDAEWFRRELRPNVRVEATGSPRYDRLAEARENHGGDGLPEVPPGTPVVLFASQPFVQGDAARSPWERWGIVEMVLDAMRRARGYRVVVKWHPSETPERLVSPADERLAQRIHHRDAFPLIRRASAVVAVSSTVALEAMYLDRPVVFLGPPISDSPFRPPEDGGGLRARTADEMLVHLDALLTDGSFRKDVLAGQRRYLDRTYAPLDGKASERVVQLLRGG